MGGSVSAQDTRMELCCVCFYYSSDFKSLIQRREETNENKQNRIKLKKQIDICILMYT